MEKPRRDEQPVRGPAAGQRGRLRFAWPAARSSVCHSCSMNISAVCGETWARRTSRAAWHVELPGDAENASRWRKVPGAAVAREWPVSLSARSRRRASRRMSRYISQPRQNPKAPSGTRRPAREAGDPVPFGK